MKAKAIAKIIDILLIMLFLMTGSPSIHVSGMDSPHPRHSFSLVKMAAMKRPTGIFVRLAASYQFNFYARLSTLGVASLIILIYRYNQLKNALRAVSSRHIKTVIFAQVVISGPFLRFLWFYGWQMIRAD